MKQVEASKMILVLILVFAMGTIFGIFGYLKTRSGTLFPQPERREVSKIEISSDKKSILDAETKELIFAVQGTQVYLETSGYSYNPDTFQTTNAKYAGNCFSDASLSNNKDRIVFSSGCLSGDLPQAWIGVYEFPKSGFNTNTFCGYNNDSSSFGLIPSAHACISRAIFYFLTSGSGKNFTWSADDKTVTYEADLGLSGMAETRTIDSKTGEVTKREIKPSADISSWLTYNSTADAETYFEEYKIKYPREIFSKPERAKGTGALSVFFKDKFGKILFSAEALSPDNGGLAYNSQNYYISDVVIGNNNFQELRDKKTGTLIYLYKTGYEDANHKGDYKIIFRIFDSGSKEVLIAAMGTLQFLGENTGEAIIGADEGSWKKVFKSEEYGFQMKHQNGLNVLDNLGDLSLVFVDSMGIYGNISLNLARLSGVSTAEEWLDRELTINANAPKKSEREYYRIGDSDEVGIMVNQADNSGKNKNRAFYTARGQYLYAIKASLTGVNEFAYYRMVANFRFLEPKSKLAGLKSRWGVDSVFEFNSNTGKLERILNEADFMKKGYKQSDIEWYMTKTAGIIPDEIKSFFPLTIVEPQGLLSRNGWQVYSGKNNDFEFMYPEDWELDDFSDSDMAFFNVNKGKENTVLPKVTVVIDRTPTTTKTLSMVGYAGRVKFGNTESLIILMYGEKGDTDPYSYLSSGNSLYVEFHSGAHDYFIEYRFNGQDFNKNMQILYTLLSSMKFYR